MPINIASANYMLPNKQHAIALTNDMLYEKLSKTCNPY